MVGRIKRRLRELFQKAVMVQDYGEPPARYHLLRRNLVLLMVLVTMIPLLLMAVINYLQYSKTLRGEITHPLRMLANKTKHSFELFLTERLSAVSFIASAYSFEQLADGKTMNRVFRAMKEEFKGFVDLGLVDSTGFQLNYVGPYELQGKNYEQQSWFDEVQVRGDYISDVFMGYRKFPHLVIAVQQMGEAGHWWVLRATIDTTRFDDVIASMGLDPDSDAFLVNHEGVFQTDSKFYGKVLEKCPLRIMPVSYEANVTEQEDPYYDRNILVAYTYFAHPSFVLVVVSPRAEVLKAWYHLKSELFFVFVGGVLGIFLVVFKLTDLVVQRVKASDERREQAFRDLQHSHKLSSIGRLAAGVAHEINNPLAIINEKAGLMKDLIGPTADFQERDKFLSHVDSILRSVERCRSVTHRLLGFARRMEIDVEVLDLNEVVKETLGFLEKEALYRNIQIRLQFADNLPGIESDRGQLQQVFLNILTNALAAVDNGGLVSITTWDKDVDTVAVSIQDNGSGMSDETLKQIFEPFFSTKREYGTGLGLSITYGIVKKLGGEIKVQSKLNEGTIFTVYLPKRPGERLEA